MNGALCSIHVINHEIEKNSFLYNSSRNFEGASVAVLKEKETRSGATFLAQTQAPQGALRLRRGKSRLLSSQA